VDSDLSVIEQSDWPREIVTNKGVIVVYQPQPEQLEGNLLKARAAVGIEVQGLSPVFGVVWFDAISYGMSCIKIIRYMIKMTMVINNAKAAFSSIFLPHLNGRKLYNINSQQRHRQSPGRASSGISSGNL